jgi:hypothetical protein
MLPVYVIGKRGTICIFKQIFTEQKINSIPNPCDLVVDMLLDILGGMGLSIAFSPTSPTK